MKLTPEKILASEKKFHNNAKSLARSLEKIAPLLKDKINIVAQAAVADMFVDIIKSTPVDTGRARASWFMGNSVDENRIAPMKEEKAASDDPPPTTDQFTTIGATQPTGKYWIWNNLKYIIFLEAGSSKQSKTPGKIVANNIGRLAKYFRQQYKKLS